MAAFFITGLVRPVTRRAALVRPVITSTLHCREACRSLRGSANKNQRSSQPVRTRRAPMKVCKRQQTWIGKNASNLGVGAPNVSEGTVMLRPADNGLVCFAEV